MVFVYGFDFLTRGSKLIQKCPIVNSKGNQSSDSENDDFVDADVIVAEVDLATPFGDDAVEEITFAATTIEDTIEEVAPTTTNTDVAVEKVDVVLKKINDVIALATTNINGGLKVIDLVPEHVNAVIDGVTAGTVDDVVEETVGILRVS